jgi:hypothetical protein
MADEQKTASVTISLSDPRLWALVAAIAGGQFAASKLSLNNVETQQQQVSKTAERAVEKQSSIDDKLGELKAAQDQFQGEMRYRLEQSERRMRELQDSIDTKTTTKAGK